MYNNMTQGCQMDFQQNSQTPLLIWASLYILTDHETKDDWVTNEYKRALYDTFYNPCENISFGFLNKQKKVACITYYTFILKALIIKKLENCVPSPPESNL
uniref:Uncharacterized protein n=1 Tax=Cacopsylla melanoneura TaxID=428564 RepID=A0A8D8SAL3_9HEMI